MKTTKYGDCRVQRGGMKSFDELEFTDNFMFCKVMENYPELCKQLAQLCTGEKFGEILIHKEHMIEITPDGHGVRFDVCMEGDNAICDIEMQINNRDNLPKRSRYYQGMVDIDNFERSNDYKNMKKSYIIFICMENPFEGKKLHKYTFSNMCHEDKNMELGDDAIKIFLTPDSIGNDISGEMEEFMDFVIKKRGNSDFTKGLEEAVEAIKNGEGWRPEYMHIQELYNDGREEGRAEGREEERELSINTLIKSLEKFNIPEDSIIDNLNKEYNLTKNEAKEYYKRYRAAQNV